MAKRAIILASLGLAVTCFFGSITESYAQNARVRYKSVPVTIAPRFLTAGTVIAPDQHRAAVPSMDARFISTNRELSGINAHNYVYSWNMPYAKPTFVVDFGWLASKRSGEY